MVETSLINLVAITSKYDNKKIVKGQGDNYTTDCLLDFRYCKEKYRLIAINFGKQQALDAEPKAM